MVTKRWRISRDSSKPDIQKVLSRRGASPESFLQGKDLSTDDSIQRLVDELQQEYSLSDEFISVLTKMSRKNSKFISAKPSASAVVPEPIVEDLVSKTEELSAAEDPVDEEAKKNNKKKKVEV